MYDALLTTPITKTMHNEIKKAAKEQEISMNQFCRNAIREFLNKTCKKDKKDVAEEKIK